jgi:hypothetical protein
LVRRLKVEVLVTMAEKGGTIEWIKNPFRRDIFKLLIISLSMVVISLILTIYLFIVHFNDNSYIIIDALAIVITVFLMAIPIASFSSYREAPIYIGFSKDGFYSKYNKKPKSDVYFTLEFVRWKDIKNIKQSVSYPSMKMPISIIYELKNKKLKSPFRACLLFECDHGLKYKLTDVSKFIMKRIIEESNLYPNLFNN